MKEDKGNCIKFQDAKFVMIIICISIIFFRLNPESLTTHFVLKISTELEYNFHDYVQEICWRKGFRPKLFIIKKTKNSNYHEHCQQVLTANVILVKEKEISGESRVGIHKPSQTQVGWMRRSPTVLHLGSQAPVLWCCTCQQPQLNVRETRKRSQHGLSYNQTRRSM